MASPGPEPSPPARPPAPVPGAARYRFALLVLLAAVLLVIFRNGLRAPHLDRSASLLRLQCDAARYVVPQPGRPASLRGAASALDAMRRSARAPETPSALFCLGIAEASSGSPGWRATLQRADTLYTRGGAPVQGFITRPVLDASWEVCFGAAHPDSSQVPRFAAAIRKLPAGWLTHVALERLYSRAGDARHQAIEHGLLQRSRAIWVTLLVVQTLLTAAGAAALIIAVIYRRLFPPSPAPIAAQAAADGLDSARLTAFMAWAAVALVLSVLLPGGPLFRLAARLLSPAAALALASGAVLAGVAAPAAVLARASGEGLRDGFAALGFTSRGIWRDIGTGAVGFVLLSPVLSALGMVAKLLSGSAGGTETSAADALVVTLRGPWITAAAVLLLLIAAPIAEEAAFRGALFPALRMRLGWREAAAASGLAFALAHGGGAGDVLSLWALGTACALLYQRRTSLVPCITLHLLNNALALATALAAIQ